LQFTQCETHDLWQIIKCRPAFLSQETQICLFPILSFLKIRDFYRFRVTIAKAIENRKQNSGKFRHNKVIPWTTLKIASGEKTLKRLDKDVRDYIKMESCS